MLKATRRARQAISEDCFKRRRTMKKSTWQWLSGASIGTAIGVGLLAVGLTPWIVAAVGVAAAVGINKFELE
jgi:hypothetical protein